MPCVRVIVLALMVFSPFNAFCFDLSFADSNVYVVENTGAATVSVTRVGTGDGFCSAGIRSIQNTAAPGWDYITTTGRVEFAPGQTVAQQVIPLISDTIPEATKAFRIVLEGLSNCAPGGLTNGTITVLDAQTIETMPQNFESGLPVGWSIATNADTNCYWRFDNPGSWPNYTGGKGVMVIADSDAAGEYAMDTELRTVPFAVATTALTYLVFKTDYYVGSYDIADVDVSGSGMSGPWTNLWRKQLYDYSGPVTELVELTPAVKGVSNVMVRFHYYNAYYDGYWQIDDVAILVEPDANTNGLPDWWETQYFGVLTNLNAQEDSDGDGALNGDEFIAGTDPRGTGSCFRVTELSWLNDNVTTRFPTAKGHFYDLLSRTNLMNQTWANGITRLHGVGGDTNITLPAPGPNGYYRLDVSRW